MKMLDFQGNSENLRLQKKETFNQKIKQQLYSPKKRGKK